MAQAMLPTPIHLQRIYSSFAAMIEHSTKQVVDSTDTVLDDEGMVAALRVREEICNNLSKLLTSLNPPSVTNTYNYYYYSAPPQAI